MKSSHVEITFDGLMVFHPIGNHYEVGVLDAVAAPAPHHEFKITVTPDIGHPIEVERLKALGNAWVLEVENGIENRVTVFPNHHTNRFDDRPESSEDFSWIMDIEHAEFHGKKLELIPGKLKPIILLSKGELFTMHKSYRLKRKRRIGTFSDFGFVADKIGLRLVLQGNEELVLKVIGQGGNGVAFRLNTETPSYNVAIENIMPPRMVKDKTKDASEPRHYQFYYGLFDNVFWFRKFEFKQEPKPSVYSRKDADNSKTPDNSIKCCPYICGQLLLGQMDHPLW